LSTLAPFLINWLQQYGYPALWLCVFIASIGIPLPISLVFLAAGAFSALGDFNVLLLTGIGITASVSGDSVGYLLGRKWGSKIFTWLGRQKRFSFISAQAIEKSRIYFNRRGGWAIFLSRFLFSGLGGSLNLLAGAEFFPYKRYLLYDFSGEILGTCIPLSLGYIFGASWEAIGDILSTLSLVMLALLCVVYFSWRFIKQLKQARGEKKQERKEREGGEGEGEIATFSTDQTYTKKIDSELQPGLDILAGNYTKNGSEGLE
jgi:membrane-associated protein